MSIANYLFRSPVTGWTTPSPRLVILLLQNDLVLRHETGEDPVVTCHLRSTAPVQRRRGLLPSLYSSWIDIMFGQFDACRQLERGSVVRRGCQANRLLHGEAA